MSATLIKLGKKQVVDLIEKRKELENELQRIDASLALYTNAFVDTMSYLPVDNCGEALGCLFDRFDSRAPEMIRYLLLSYGFKGPMVDISSYSTTIYYKSVVGVKHQLIHLFESMVRMVGKNKNPVHFYRQDFKKDSKKYDLTATVSIVWSNPSKSAEMIVKSNGSAVKEGSIDYQLVLDEIYK